MRGFLSYKIGSPEHSLIVSRINEHHHRYGIYINSDDILYLIIHFAFSPIDWVNKFGYRQLEAFEVHAV
jgi:outer membrane protein assembly factor BamD (BamD/ComL family)